MSTTPVLRARRILDRLKRGVPPIEGLSELSVGMDSLEAHLIELLQPGRVPRWFAVQNDYGEGKSHFHSFARQRALKAGYAVASLDVNKDDGALHQPQRHVPVLLDSLRSPLDCFADAQGIREMLRIWLDATPQQPALEILQKCQDAIVQPLATRAPDEFGRWILRLRVARSAPSLVNEQACREALAGYFAAERLTSRFAAAYHIQLVERWLVETGHKVLCRKPRILRSCNTV
jgi:hypothetical protein